MSLGLPDGIRSCPFDLDGVLTKTAAVHAVAWKEMFDSADIVVTDLAELLDQA